MNDAEGSALGRDLLVCQLLAAALSRRLVVVAKRLAADHSYARSLLAQRVSETRYTVRDLERALEVRAADLAETCAFIAENMGGWDDDAEDAAEMEAAERKAAERALERARVEALGLEVKALAESMRRAEE